MFTLPRSIARGLATATVFAGVIAVSPHTDAAVPEDEQQTLQLVIETQLEKAVNNLVKPRSVADQLFLDWPVKPPTADIDTIEQQVEERITLMGARKFADRTDEYYQKLALDRYPIYRVYQTRTVTLKSGEEVSGYIREIEDTFIKINEFKIARDQLSEDSLVHFDRDLAAQKIDAFIRLRKAELAEERKQYEADIRTDVERDVYTQHGYIQIRGEWKPQIVYFEERIASLKHRYRERLRGYLTAHVYYDNGYVQYRGEWMTPQQREATMQNEAKGGGGQSTPTAPIDATGGDEDELFGGGN